MKCFLAFLAALALLGSGDAQAQSRHIHLTGCNVWPNERSGADGPSAAIDGNTATLTWCTSMYNTSNASIGIAFEDSAEVTRIRLWKDDDGTGWPTPMAKDLVILVTTDNGPLEQRAWTRVSGLIGSFDGAEVFHADSIGSDGYVWGDVHDSVHDGDGWGSLVFDPVVATGVCIQFANSPGNTVQYVHYKLHELEAYAVGAEATSASSWGRIKSLFRE
jgi:hypothetical protein